VSILNTPEKKQLADLGLKGTFHTVSEVEDMLGMVLHMRKPDYRLSMQFVGDVAMFRYRVFDKDGGPCTFSECPPGHFVAGDALCFKSEYTNDAGMPEAYCESGEYYHGASDTVVQPVMAEWKEEEE
jgi:hypothetical protein